MSNLSSKVEDRPSQTSLDPPADIAIPDTPNQIKSPPPVLSNAISFSSDTVNASDKASVISPPLPPSSSEITPPPTVHNNQANTSTPMRTSRSGSNPYLLASPPSTVDQTLCVAYGASEHLPTISDIEHADETTLQKMAKELLVVAQEFRMSAAHFKLQHSLLSLTSSEAVKRAEVEQHLARREVEILQSEEYQNRSCRMRSAVIQPTQEQLAVAGERIKELEQTNATLDRRLRRAKQVIEEDSDNYELLLEENSRLKKRIRDNREHFTLMMDNGSLSSSPRAEFSAPQIKSINRYPESARPDVGRVRSQDPFAALLAADQVLSRESASLQASPSKYRNIRNFNGHTRGTHSLSSLPTTPPRPRAMESNRPQYFTPVNNRTGDTRFNGLAAVSEDFGHQNNDDVDRYDRDSTLSASDVEAVTDEDVPASQASSLATSMLRRYPGPPQEEPSVPANINKSSTLLQTKLFGHVKKPGIERPDTIKRKGSTDEGGSSFKKARARSSFGVDVETSVHA